MGSRMEELRAFAMAFDGTWEDHPWSEDHNVFKTSAGKMFIGSSEDSDGGLTVTLKLTPEEGAEALTLPFVSVAQYVGRYGWVTARVTNEAEMDITLEWVRRSHELVVGSKKRARNA